MTDAPGIAVDPSGESPGGGGAIVLREMIGVVVLLLVVRAAEPLLFGDGFYGTLSAHPYWIVVILAATQGGILTGVLTAAFAALMMDWPPRPIGVDITEHYVSAAIVPVQWLLAATIIGAFRQQQISCEMQLAAEVRRLTGMNTDFAREVERLDREIADLELRAATGANAQSPISGNDPLPPISEPAPDAEMTVTGAS